jgi:GTP-binding protein
MKVINPEFVLSAFSFKDFPGHDLAEFAFVGRSNVGKSSLINKLINRKKLARTSSQPGRTQSINFYNIDDKFFLVDLPGYGFARVPIKVKDDWGKLINEYLENRDNLKGVIHLLDARHIPTRDDRIMLEWLKKVSLPILIVVTKVDKISRAKRKDAEYKIKNFLELDNAEKMVFFSAKTGEGKDEIGKFIIDLL